MAHDLLCYCCGQQPPFSPEAYYCPDCLQVLAECFAEGGPAILNAPHHGDHCVSCGQWEDRRILYTGRSGRFPRQTGDGVPVCDRCVREERSAWLRRENARRSRRREWQNNALLQQCLTALGEYRLVLEEGEEQAILAQVNCGEFQPCSAKAPPPLPAEREVCVVWDEAALPVVWCLGGRVARCWPEVLAVAFDTCIFDPETGQRLLIRG